MQAGGGVQQALVLLPREVPHEDAHLEVLVKLQPMALLPISSLVVVLIILQVEERALDTVVREVAGRWQVQVGVVHGVDGGGEILPSNAIQDIDDRVEPPVVIGGRIVAHIGKIRRWKI